MKIEIAIRNLTSIGYLIEEKEVGKTFSYLEITQTIENKEVYARISTNTIGRTWKPKKNYNFIITQQMRRGLNLSYYVRTIKEFVKVLIQLTRGMTVQSLKDKRKLEIEIPNEQSELLAKILTLVEQYDEITFKEYILKGSLTKDDRRSSMSAKYYESRIKDVKNLVSSFVPNKTLGSFVLDLLTKEKPLGDLFF